MASFPYKCKQCDYEYLADVDVYDSSSRCPECGGRGRVIEGTKRSQPGESAIVFLRIVAWLNLVGGVLACILYLGVFLENVNDISYEWVSNNLILSIVSFFGGVCGCALLLVVCSIADNLIGIRKNTEIIKEGMIEDEQELLQGNDSGVIDDEVQEEVSDA